MLYGPFHEQGGETRRNFYETLQAITTKAKRLFDWTPEKFFFQTENPGGSSDHEETLTKLVGEHVIKSDIILTTPGQYKIFPTAEKAVFDISPAQLGISIKNGAIVKK